MGVWAGREGGGAHKRQLTGMHVSIKMLQICQK